MIHFPFTEICMTIKRDLFEAAATLTLIILGVIVMKRMIGHTVELGRRTSDSDRPRKRDRDTAARRGLAQAAHFPFRNKALGSANLPIRRANSG